jgi:YidC/Oxa1 family membrane protein insertase
LPVLTAFHQMMPMLASIPVWTQYKHILEVALDFLAKNLHNAGIAVIVFTILVKTALMPLTITSIKSSKAMQELQPKIKELQKKHGKDRQKLSQETMKLYSQYHVNPMAGCLPMIIQMPIFWGVYRAITSLSHGSSGFSHFWQGGFLWLPSLAAHDQYHILPIAAGVFQFIQTKMMKPAGQGKSSDPQQAMMNSMMNFMPLMVVVFGWTFASGPVVYWVTQSIFSVVQQWFITGWGSMHDWIPGLPELPEHRRLGYRPPRNLDDVVVVSGEAPKQSGVMGWFNKKMQEAQAQANANRDKSGQDDDDVIETTAAPAKGARPVKKSSTASRAAAARKAKEPAASEDGETPKYASDARSSNGAAVGTAVPRRSRPKRDQSSAPE